jgi:hypothetical protein
MLHEVGAFTSTVTEVISGISSLIVSERAELRRRNHAQLDEMKAYRLCFSAITERDRIIGDEIIGDEII